MKKKKIYRRGTFFPVPGPRDPITSIFGAAGNMLVDHGLRWLSQKAANHLGLNVNITENQLRMDRLRLSVARQEADLARVKFLNERHIRMLDLRIEQKAIEVERAQRQLENALTQDPSITLDGEPTVICGALEVTADPKGLEAIPEQAEAYNRWLDGFQEGKIVLVTGRRGSGKTALIAKMAEYMSANYKMPTYWLGLPDVAQKLVPRWITLVDDAHKCPVGSFIVCDEAGINFLSLLFQDKRNVFMRRLMMVCRQRHCSLAFAVQNTRDVDLSVVRQADSLIIKRPGAHQPETERAEIRPLVKKAAQIFNNMTPEECLESALVFDDDFEGVIKFSPPSFWTEDLSHIYANLDLMAIENEAQNRKALRNTVTEASHQLDEASLDSKILELRKKHGIDAIARILNCSQYRVRKTLEDIDGGYHDHMTTR